MPFGNSFHWLRVHTAPAVINYTEIREQLTEILIIVDLLHYVHNGDYLILDSTFHFTESRVLPQPLGEETDQETTGESGDEYFVHDYQ